MAIRALSAGARLPNDVAARIAGVRGALKRGALARPDLIGIALLGLLAFGCVVARCVLVSITHDEAITARGAMTGTIAQIVQFSAPGAADNNHMLFTLLAKLSVRRLGAAEWAMRLPSALGFILYVVATALILARSLRGIPLLLLFALAVFNPAVMEMMSIARGYGLGIAFSVAGAYCLLRGGESDRPQRAAWWTAAIVCMALATLAHLTCLLFLVVAMALIVVIEARVVIRGGGTLRAGVVMLVRPLAIGALVAPLLVHQIGVLGPAGLLATEGLVSFHQNTVLETVRYSLGSVDVPAWLLGGLVIAAYAVPALALGAVLANRGGRGRPTSNTSTASDLPILLALLVGASVLSIVQHHVAGVAYLSGRRAVALAPFFVLVCGALAGFTPRNAPLLQPALRWIVCVLALVLVGCIVPALNLDTTVAWKFDADTRVMMSDVKALLAHRPASPPARIGITWICEPAMNFYRQRLGMTNLAPVERDSPVGLYDLYYIQVRAAEIGEPGIAAIEAAVGPLTIIKEYPRAGAVLAVPAGSALAQWAAAPTDALGARSNVK